MGICAKMKYFLLSIVVCFAISCKKMVVPSTISLDSSLSLKLSQLPGSNLDPFTDELLAGVGFPAGIAYHTDLREVPVLLFGKDLKSGKIPSRFIGAVELKFKNEVKLMGIAVAEGDKHQTVDWKDLADLQSNHYYTKVWLNDYLMQAYKNQQIKDLAWYNNARILRELVNKNTTK